MASAVEADLHDAGGGDVDELDVAAVGLDGWSDQVEDALDALAKIVGFGGGHALIIAAFGSGTIGVET